MGLKSQGLKAYEAFNDEGKPLCIIPADGSDGGLSLSVYTNDGEVIGVAVYDGEADYKCLSTAGFVPESALDEDEAPSFKKSGWYITRPSDNTVWHFDSLTGLQSAISEGTFGVKLRQPADDNLRAKDFSDGWQAGYDQAGYDSARAAEQETWKVNAKQEPLGWNAPELQEAPVNGCGCSCPA